MELIDGSRHAEVIVITELIDVSRPATSRKNWRRLQRNSPRLTNLKISLPRRHHRNGPIIAEADIGELGRDIGNSTHILRLELLGADKYDGGFKEYNIDEARRKFQLLCQEMSQNRSIKDLHLSDFYTLGGDMRQFLTPFLETNIASNSNLQCISLKNCNISLEGMDSLVTHLMRRGAPFDELSLVNCGINDIDDDFVEALVMKFRENPTLTPKKLALASDSIGQNGWGFVATLLKDPRCTMEVLDLSSNFKIKTETIIVFANALAENSILQELLLRQTFYTTTGLRACSQCLCNTTSIEATYSSNHTLQVVSFNPTSFLLDESSDDSDDDSDNAYFEFNQNLGWNKNANKKVVARRKVFQHHFLHNFKMEPFEGMAPELLVRTLNFIDKASLENGGITNADVRNLIISQLIKNNPMVCEIVKPMSIEKGTIRKRRHSL